MLKNPLDKQWDKLLKQEQSFLKKSIDKKESKLDNFLAEKVPDKLQQTLNTAFSKSFTFVFDKGTGVIEKSYNREEIEHMHKVNAYSFSMKKDRKRAKVFEKQASKAEAANVVISGVKGVGLGFLGIGLPDIPVFIGMVLKGIYEIALQYGYDYDSEEERYFILSIISTALSSGTEITTDNEKINKFIINPILPEDYSRDVQINKACNVLSTELLCMKFVQGLPVVGVIGGVSDAVFVKKILDFAKIKYKRRFLNKYIFQTKD